MKKLFILTSAISLILLPFAASGADYIDPFDQGIEPQDLPDTFHTYGDVINFIQAIASWMFGILLAVAVIFLIYAAFLYLTSAGNPTKIESAKGIIIYAAVAILLGVLAKGIVMVIQTLIE